MDLRFHPETLIKKSHTETFLNNTKLNFNHMLLEFKVKNLAGILRQNKEDATIYGFMLFESAKADDPIKIYQ